MRNVIFLLLMVFIYIPISGAQQSGYSIGVVAADFKLEGTDGKLVSMADYPSARGFVIIFMSDECRFDKAYQDRIIHLHNRYAPQGIQVIGIHSNHHSGGRSASSQTYPFPYIQDESGKVFSTFGAIRTPHVFLLNHDRKVIYSGAIDDNVFEPDKVKTKMLETALNSFLAGKGIAEPVTKPVGCSVRIN